MDTFTLKDRGVLDEGDDELEGFTAPPKPEVVNHPIEETLKFQVDTFEDAVFKPRKSGKKRKVDETDTLEMKMNFREEPEEEEYYDRLMKMRPVHAPPPRPVEESPRKNDFTTAWLSRISKPKEKSSEDVKESKVVEDMTEVSVGVDELPGDVDMTEPVGVDSDLSGMREAPLDEGTASFLNMIKARGMLKDTKRQGDRGDIRLEYRDEFGRSLGPKEAYKQLSWAFHGNKPGKKKQERRLMIVENDRKVSALDSHEKVTTLQALHATAEREQKPYLVLSDNKGINP